MLSKTIECLPMALIAHKEEGFSLFRLLFAVGSGSLQPVLTCYGCSGLFHYLLATTSQNDMTSKFTINQLHVDFTTAGEVGQAFFQSGTNVFTK